MKHTEYIIPIGEEAQDYDEVFIGVIRRQPELVRCKDCARNENCFMYRETGDDNGYCAWAVKREKRSD